MRVGLKWVELVIISILGCSCGDDDGSEGALRFDTAPNIEMAPNANAPLVGLLTLETNQPTTVTVTLDDGSSVSTLEFDELDTEHALTILGFKPDHDYVVGVRVTTDDGESLDAAGLETTLGPLPDDFPILDVVVSDESKMEPGVTMIAVQAANEGAYIVMMDSNGDVVWYLHHDNKPGDTRRLANGNLLLNNGDRLSAVEVDMRGDVVRTWHAANSTELAGSIPVATDSFHHEVFPMVSGNFLAVSSEQRSFDDYPSSPTDPTPRQDPLIVVGDVIVEFESDGTVVGEWALLDILDPYRVGYDSFGGYWNSFYEGGGADWSHTNAVIHDPSDDTIIVSSRHQDAVVKFDRAGEIVWILGPHENWNAPWDQYLLNPIDAEFAFQYHQHSPEITPADTLLMFDNGRFRASPPDTPATDEFSRVLEVEIDPSLLQVAEVWSYEADREIYSSIVGDADWLPVTGNVLVDFGGLLPTSDAEPSARIIEVTHTTPAVEVFELQVWNNNPTGTTTVYRSERLPGLYP